MSWKAWEGATHQLAVATAHLTAGSTSGGELECRLGDEPPVLEELVVWTRNAQAGEEPCRGLGKLLRHPLALPSKTRNGTTRSRSAAVSAPADDDENAELFSAVLSTLNREQLPFVAMAILQRTHPAQRPSVGEPVYGSYHVLFPLTFDIDLRWVAKIPINGTADK